MLYSDPLKVLNTPRYILCLSVCQLWSALLYKTLEELLSVFQCLFNPDTMNLTDVE